MSHYDIILRGGKVVSHSGEQIADIGIANGKIAALQPGLFGSTREEINATGLDVFPGLIDAHVHFNEPGRADWEGIETGSRALAAGGGTMFFDMPLNAHPPTCNAESFDLKLAAAKKKSLTDFAFWGGLVPGNLDQLEELSERGVIGFKAFMANSGIDDFSCVDDAILREGMIRIAKFGKLVAVHAESDSLTRDLAQQRIALGQTSIRDYLASRPIQAELDAIRRAIDLAGETKCALHIVHVSSGEGIALVVEAKKSGVDVSCETCPHYLVLTEEDVERLGAVAKCAPPLRSAEEQSKLWEHLMAGDILNVGSDHSPSPPGMKQHEDFFKIWGGISGVQHTLPLLLAGNPKHALSLSQIAQVTSLNIAQRFKLPATKGRLEIGADADLAVVDLNQEFIVRAEDLFYRHKQSPYVGRTLRGRVARTLLRGKTIFLDGKIVANANGNLVKPIV